MRSPGARQPSGFLAAVGLLLMAVFVAPGAHASGETSRLRAVVEAGVSQGTVLGSPWEPRTAYSVSLLGLWEAGQGMGVRLSWLPPATSAEAWELSTDAVARFTGEGPLYFKASGGVAVTPSPLWSPRLRAGGEVGVHAIRGSIGLEVGLGGVYSFPPSQLAHGEGVVSLGVGILFGFGTPSRTPALAPPQHPWAQQSAQSPAGAFQPQGPGSSSAAEARTAGRAPAPSEMAHVPSSERDVIQRILLLRKPGDVLSWWASGPGEDMRHWAHPLSEWERQYVEAMSSATVPEPVRMWPPVRPERLSPEQTEDMERRMGAGAAAAEGYAHWENRRRIVKHYVLTHPATLQLSLGLYGLARDSNPLFFALERGWQMGSGQELLTTWEVSRLGAAQEFFTALAAGVAAGRLMSATRPVPGWGVPEPVESVGPGKVKAPPAPPRATASAPEPAPSPGQLAPSPGLVQALTGKNPTPPMAPGPRLSQDVAVKPMAPRPLPTDRPVGPSPSQNAQVQADVDYLESIGAKNIRVNQQQVTLRNGQRVGINRPDLQFDYNGRRYQVEYDTPTSGRGPGHQSRITANDPNAEIILLIVP